MEITSPSRYSLPFTTILLSDSYTAIALHPATQHLPIPRATTAAWDVIPPLAVRIPSAATIPARSSGEVSSLTSITFLPAAAASAASSALNTISPQAAPGDAGSPFATLVALESSSASNVGCSSWLI